LHIVMPSAMAMPVLAQGDSVPMDYYGRHDWSVCRLPYQMQDFFKKLGKKSDS